MSGRRRETCILEIWKAHSCEPQLATVIDDRAKLLDNQDASYDPGTERLVRLWLLDAAIQQFIFDTPSKRKQEAWLPDCVFPDPGMSEEEMVDFMEIRDAPESCIMYAREKYEQTNGKGRVRNRKVSKKDVATATKVSGSKGVKSNVDKYRHRAIDYLINPMRAFQRFSKRLKRKDGVGSKVRTPNDTLSAFPVSHSKKEDFTETKSV